jgi:hypothetical protein
MRGLVAGFNDADTASEMADELETFFAKHAEEMDAADGERRFPRRATRRRASRKEALSEKDHESLAGLARALEHVKGVFSKTLFPSWLRSSRLASEASPLSCLSTAARRPPPKKK